MRIALATILLFLLLGGIADSQTVTTKLYRVPRISWEPPTTNADGTPLDDLAGYMIAVTAEGEDVNAGAAVLAERLIDSPATLVFQDASILSELSAQRYSVWVAAFDTAGNVSQYSGPAPLDATTLAPSSPSGVKVEVRVIHEIGG